MKKQILSLLLLLLNLSVSQAQDVKLTTQNMDSLLQQAYEKDQTVRKQTLDLINKGNTSGLTASMTDSLMLLSEETERIDAENLQLITSVLKQGWPKNLQEESYHAIFILVDHADSDVNQQKKFLPYLKQGAKEGDISFVELATFEDRILLRAEKPQIYGTQTQWGTSEKGESVIYVWPVKDPSQLNDIRKEVGLSTMEEYLKALEESAGVKVIYDPHLTVNAIKERSGMQMKVSDSQ